MVTTKIAQEIGKPVKEALSSCTVQDSFCCLTLPMIRDCSCCMSFFLMDGTEAARMSEMVKLLNLGHTPDKLKI